MARITTKTGVANLALILGKNDIVSSIEPPPANSKAAKLCAFVYEDSRREALSESNWDFAIKRTSLPAHATAPDFGYTSKYELPADFIRIATIGDETDPETEYEIEDGFLYINETESLNFRYVYDHSDITKWSPKFLQTVARCILKNIAYNLTGNRSFALEMEQDYREYLSDGRQIDAQGNPPKRVQRSKWKLAKQVGTGDGLTSGRTVI